MGINPWDIEYNKKGIPSSYRNAPSNVLVWAIKNWSILSNQDMPRQVLDVGCGNGRNVFYLNTVGCSAFGFDNSESAIRSAKESYPTISNNFFIHDLNGGIPYSNESFDLMVDIFVYKHQTDFNKRQTYRKEINRVLKRNGRLLLSLSELSDGYYSVCPQVDDDNNGNLKTIYDPAAKVESVLFTLEDLVFEMRELFILEMSWSKSRFGTMHNQSYLRKTLATIWKPI